LYMLYRNMVEHHHRLGGGVLGRPGRTALQFWLWKGQLRAVRRTGTIVVPIDSEESKEHYNIGGFMETNSADFDV